ncbi:MAG: 50S ribosomal protein L9 [Acidimicrobiaceae bacterium]|jgi:large subunit ribosomal protein L9|nr:50S ribosomal protein L9 [Acidimicrobiaceae bacterium]MEC7426936.1 50S ribosomal protein L9 [Actinomycetota bacterium]MEC9089466.1 50S ribosomal protein L9 [Actinomycetota bacterium]|tara:strand:- start:2450 stop:2899 length:450 start_codon:yes stop_codon:yes gene_type:complete
MKVILRSNVEGVGYTGDVVEVANGYAQNFLMPKGLAMRATEGAVSQAAAMKRSRDLQDLKQREVAEEAAQRLEAVSISIEARVGQDDQLYGSVTTSDIAEAVQAQTGIELDRRNMSLEEPIRQVGTHQVEMRLHPEVRAQLTIEVASVE